MASQTHYRTCNLCEAMCGIEIEHEGTNILSIKGDKNDHFSKGHICPKAVALQDFYHDPDRLKTPIKKTANGWVDISWEDAFKEVVGKIKSTQDQYGKNALGTYIGNPNAHNLGNVMVFPEFFKAIGTNNRYSSASADQLPHHVAAHYMLGHGMLIPIPDIERTDFMLIIGGNPMVSNGSMMTCPDFAHRMKAIQKRGGKVVVVDPRRTETADKADEHLFIKPEKDALFLAAMINTIFRENKVKLGHLEDIIDGFRDLEQGIQQFTPEAVASATGIPATKIKALALDMANASSAVCYSRMGASTQSFGGLCQWLTNVFNIITGNFDKEGGAMFTEPAFDFMAITSRKGRPNSYGRYQSRVRKLPFFNGEFPVAALEEEITTPGEGQIKMLMCIAGNPVLSSPNGAKLEAAFEQLDYMVSVDIYLNETSRLADIILPAATGLELNHFDVFFNSFAVRNTVKFSPALFEKTADQRYDWEILKTISAMLTGKKDNGITPEMMLDNVLQMGTYGKDGMSLKKLKENPHGIDLGPLRTCLKSRIQTDDDRIQLAPEFFINDLNRLTKALSHDASNNAYPLQMIGRRLLRSHNTWLHNSYRLVKGRNECTLLINPEDANPLGISNGEKVVVRSPQGQLEIEARISDEMMPGVVSIPQGWGHRKKGMKMKVAEEHAGVSINDLTDAGRIDELTGNAAFNGVAVAVQTIEHKSL